MTAPITQSPNASNAYFTAELVDAPKCHAIISGTRENMCACFRNFLAAYQKGREYPVSEDGNISFTTCHKGDAIIAVARADRLPMTDIYRVENKKYIPELVKQLLVGYDAFRFLERTEKIGDSVYLHFQRGVPKSKTDLLLAEKSE